jgi:hypothetical protein
MGTIRSGDHRSNLSKTIHTLNRTTMTFFEELKLRLKLESPDFFKKIVKFGNWLTLVGGILMSPAAPELAGVDIPIPFLDTIVKIGFFAVFGGQLISRIASLTVADPTKLNEPPVENK